MEVIIRSSKEQQESNIGGKKYVDLKEYTKQQQQKKADTKDRVIPSKVLVIENLSVTITQALDKDIDFVIDSKPGVLPNGITIKNLDITARDDITFDDDITLSKIEKVIRRCGVLEEYSDVLTKDPSIVINSYTLNIRKDYRFFDEFKEGVLIGEEIFM